MNFRADKQRKKKQLFRPSTKMALKCIASSRDLRYRPVNQQDPENHKNDILFGNFGQTIENLNL